jgi:predicted transglutaminase-like cysteine proteinase
MINRAINLAIRPMSDLAQWGVEDRWTAPLATLASGLGDCEDYAIVKYVALSEAGIAAEDVKLVVVRDLQSTKIMRSSPLDSMAAGSFSIIAGWHWSTISRCVE